MATKRRNTARASHGRRRLGWSARGMLLALLGASVLALLSAVLLGSAPAAGAHARTSYYGLPDGLAPAGGSPTATDTTTPTQTPTPTATATPPAPTATPTPPAPTATPTPSNPYALDISAAVQEAGWPQQNSNWCGIATIAAIGDYLDPAANVSQAGIVSALNTPASESEWGYPKPDATDWGPYLAADIARDFGTDPRSLAEGLTLATGAQYHVVVDLNGAYDATIHLVDDLLNSRQPISVIVDHGEHSVLVSGVDATANPLTNPGSIKDIHVWDPGGGVPYVGIQRSMEMTVPMSQWLSGVIGWSGSDYFKYPYAANVYQGKALDPDPGVGPYAYIPAKYDHLWIGHYVYLSPVAPGPAAGLNADWELDQSGALIAGIASPQYPAVPAGYTGPTVPMPNNAPPPPPPVQPVKVAPPPAPLPPPKPAPTPRPTPRPTPTARPTATPQPTLAPVVAPPARASVCAPVGCLLAGLASGWGVALGGLLAVVGALGLVMVLRRRQRGPARIEPAVAATPPPDGPPLDGPPLEAPTIVVPVPGGDSSSAGGQQGPAES